MTSDRLTPKQRRFVDHYLSLGGVNATRAAVLAGYEGGRNGAGVTAHRLLKQPAILQAIRDLAEARLRSGVALAASVLEELAKTAKNESVRLKAAESLLDRGGLMLQTVSRHEVHVIHSKTDEELRARVEQLAKELGLAGRIIEHRPAAAPTVPAIEVVEVEDVDVVNGSD